ncbi:MAG TPA: MarR family transcriptional regulator [Acidimicrobiia bacterium]|nr:MarR family transcriptional regulator [Acidimicrobiia bacterium]
MSRATVVDRQATLRLANEAWESLLLAHATVMRRFASEEWDEVSIREYDVLYTLSKCSEPIRLGELHRHVLLSQPALSRMVDRLVARGLILRVSDPTDARGRLLSLSAEGRATQRRIGRRHARNVAAAMTTALTDAQLEDLRSICRTLAERGGGPGETVTQA